MKKLIAVIILCILLIPHNIYAEEKIKVQFKECIDGDTAKVVRNNKTIKKLERSYAFDL